MQSVAISGKGLSERVQEFLWTYDDYESIDELLRDAEHPGKKRADHFLFSRSIIIEQKTLKNDPSNKPQKFIEKLRDEGEVLFWGTLDTDTIFKRHPKGDILKRRMYDNLVRPLIENIETAEKQTSDTRSIFGLPDAMGVVLILNEAAKTLVPDTIRYGVQRAYIKKNKDGTRRYTANAGVIVLEELHSFENAAGIKLYPLMVLQDRESPHSERFQAFSEEFQRRWAAFNGTPLLPGTHEDFARAR